MEPGMGQHRDGAAPGAAVTSENRECQREREMGAAGGRVQAEPVSVPWDAQRERLECVKS